MLTLQTTEATGGCDFFFSPEENESVYYDTVCLSL